MNRKPPPKEDIINIIKDTSIRTAQFAVPMLFILLLVWRGKILGIKDDYAIAKQLKKDISYLDSIASKNNKRLNSVDDKLVIASRQNVGTDPRYKKQVSNQLKNLSSDTNDIRSLLRFLSKKKSELERRQANIKDSTNLEFDIPTLRPMTEKPRLGMILWLALLNITFFVVSLRRKKIFKQLQNLFRSFFVDSGLSVSETQNVHIPLPFWIYPFSASANSNLTFKRSIEKLSKHSLYNLCWVLLIFIVFLAISADVVSTIWDVNNSDLYFDKYNIPFRISSIALLIALIIQMISWIVFDNEITLIDYKKQL